MVGHFKDELFLRQSLKYIVITDNCYISSG